METRDHSKKRQNFNKNKYSKKMKKIILLTSIVLSINAIAQLPSYVPTNGLVGYWSFSGNANDASSNGNNGTVSGATLAADRFGNANNAYSFNGTNNYIQVPNSNSLQNISQLTMSAWFNINAWSGNQYFPILAKSNSWSEFGLYCFTIRPSTVEQYLNGSGAGLSSGVSPFSQWIHVTVVNNGANSSCYVNGVLISTVSNNAQPGGIAVGSASMPLMFGVDIAGNSEYTNGLLDDIGIWNRTLTQQEITDLYNAINCSNNNAVTPKTNSLTTLNTANFNTSASDPTTNYVWQSDFGQGFQTLNNFGDYSGVNTSSLSIANIQLSEHNQPVRVITTIGNCIDTSNVAIISIIDTCITDVTIYDTLLTTVTDTLVINAILTGLNQSSNKNTLKIFPNPANTNITIDYGDFSSMSGYSLKIINNSGQVVFTNQINQQSSYIDLSTWGDVGIYFVQIIDTQNNTIENRKILIK